MALRRCSGCMSVITEEVCPHCGCSVRQNNDSNQLPVGTVLRNQYQVGRVLGQGGFGITYIGWDTYLDMAVAIKEFYPSAWVNRDVTQSYSVRVNTQDQITHFENSRERFLREAKTLAKLREIPEIVGIQSFFTENNTAYIIMEYVQGIDLRHHVQRSGGKLSPGELFPVLEPVMRALEAVHQEGLVHRDISPDNIMLQPNGKIKLLDFGAARDVGDADADIDLSHSTEAILKHGFAPMEQYRSRGNLGPWTDEYGICATIYYCLTGKVPPDAPARAMDDAQPDWDSITGLTRQQRLALEKGMDMRAKDRFGSMEKLRQALYEQAYIPPTNIPEEPVIASASKKKILPIAAVLLLAAAAAGTLLWFSGRDSSADATLQSVPAATETTLSDTLPPETQPTAAQTVATVLPSEETIAETKPPEPWEANLMQANPLSIMGVKPYSINHAVFLDTTQDAPENATDVSVNGDRSVLAWLSYGNGCTLNVAAEGGINARQCCAGLFQNCNKLMTVTFDYAFHTEQTDSMASMFAGCDNLQSADWMALDMSNVKNTSRMFANSRIQKLEIGEWDVSGVIDMSGMFSGCKHLTKLEIGNWDVSNVRNMSNMFARSCDSLQTLDIGDWDVSSVTDMSGMFRSFRNLQTLPIGNWDVSSVTDMSGMFQECWNLKKLDVSKWNVSNVCDLSFMFADCFILPDLDVSQWDVSNVTNMRYMFCSCFKMQTPDVGSWNVSRVTDMSYMFYECYLVQGLDATNWDISRVVYYEKFMDDGKNLNGLFWKFFFEDYNT